MLFPLSYSHPPPNFSFSSFHIPLWPLESPCYVVIDQSTHNIERLRCFSLKKTKKTKKKNNSYLSVFSLQWERKGHLIVKGMCALSSDNLRGILHKQINVVRPTSCFWHHLLVINIKWETISSPGGVVPTHKSVSSRITFKKKKRESECLSWLLTHLHLWMKIPGSWRVITDFATREHFISSSLICDFGWN